MEIVSSRAVRPPAPDAVVGALWMSFETPADRRCDSSVARKRYKSEGKQMSRESSIVPAGPQARW